MTAKEALNHPWITMNIPSAPVKGAAELLFKLPYLLQARGDSLDETMTPPPDSSIEFWNVKDIIKKDSEASIAETMAGGRVLKNEGSAQTWTANSHVSLSVSFRPSITGLFCSPVVTALLDHEMDPSRYFKTASILFA